jgi:5-methyltetrahydropteroyltriglutamate--homocysteine methyltransferase
MTEPEIRTTVIGSHPVPSWLRGSPSAEARRDAVLVVLKTQELAGIYVIADGELSRFDTDHPETNG